jgi:hypothetical protein
MKLKKRNDEQYGLCCGGSRTRQGKRFRQLQTSKYMPNRKTVWNLDKEDDPSHPSRFISEAFRVASSIEKLRRRQVE